MSVADSRVQAEGSARDREIVAARVIVTCPGRNFVTLKIETRSGVVAWATPRSTVASSQWRRILKNISYPI